jgi:hypothetical protein
MEGHQSSRRQFLKGAGVAMALPLLESLPEVRAAQKVAKATEPVKRFVCLSNNYGIYKNGFFPKEAGADYALTPTLKPLERHRKEFTVFSNLDHGNTGGHQGVPVLLSGVRPHLAAGYPEGNISLDQKMAEHVGAATRFPSLTLRVNEGNLTSFTRTGVQVPAIDLRGTFRALFREQTAAEKTSRRRKFKMHGSILDLVLEQAKGVKGQLGKQDQHKFEEYLESVRSLEKKIVQQEPWVDRPKPKTDLPEPPQGQGTAADLKAMMELIALAIQTDSTRAITISSGFVNGDFGLNGGYHGFSHHGNRESHTGALMKIEANMTAQMAHLIDLLKAQDDLINGGTLFDHTMIFFGCGMATGTHSTKNLPLLLAGGGFKHGESKIYPEEDPRRVPAANLLLSMLQNFGVEADRFGTSTGTLTGLERKS